MKKLILLLSAVACFASSQAQDYLGLSTGNYSGIQGVMLQPANVADNRYKFELNLISTNIGFQNNYLGFSREFFIKNRFSFKDYDTYADFQQNVLSEQTINGNRARFNLNNRLNLPSVLFTTGKNSGIAIGIQSRTGIAIDNMNVDFARQLYNNFQDASGYNRVNTLDGLTMNAMNWVEGSLTYGRVLLDNGKHFLKAGVTAKYLGGVSSWYLQANDLDITVNNDSTLRASGSDVRYGHSESNFSGAQIKDFEPDASGLGFDAGLVYEFRGRINKFKFLKANKAGDDFSSSTRRDKNKYSFKVGVSLLDAGKLTFNSTPLARDFSTNASATINGINIKNTGIQNVQDLDTFIAGNVNYAGAVGQEFSVAMPTALSAQVDLHLVKGFYINAMAYRPFTSLNKETDSRVFTPNYYAVTPRWESRAAGLYVPIVLNNNYNDARELTAGATLRVGPMFVGTSNMLTLFQKDEIQNANVHLGFKIPVAHGKPSKASKWLKKFTNESDDEVTVIDNSIEKEVIIKEKISEKEVETEIEKVKEEKAAPIQIIINNYNSAGGAKKSQRIVDVDPITGEQMERTIIVDEDDSYETKDGGDYQEMRSLQEQIEYLKFKLKQKENLINEIEIEQNRIKNGNSTEESKKKINSLKEEYLYNNNYKFNGVDWDTSNSVFDKRGKLFELRKQLITVDNKNAALDQKLAMITLSAERQEVKTIDAVERMDIRSLKTIIADVRQKEYLTLEPVNARYRNQRTADDVSILQKKYYPKKQGVDLGYKEVKNFKFQEIPRRKGIRNVEYVTKEIVPNTKRDEDLVQLRTEMQNLQEQLNQVNARETELNNSLQFDTIRSYTQNKEIERLNNEIYSLRSELKTANTNVVTTPIEITRDSAIKQVTKVVVDTIDNPKVATLENEVESLRSELDDYKKAAAKKGKKPVRIWRRFGSSSTGTGRNKSNGINVAPVVQMVRDTVYVDRTVEKIVTKVVRDTVTNTVEKNNIITKTKEVKVDNTMQKLLERPAYFVLFGSGSADIQNIYRDELNFYAKQIRTYPGLKLRLTGHADATGNAARNLELSKARAQQVRNYLIQRGVPRARISIDFSGDKSPLETNKTKVGKSQNRRVEVLFVD